MKNIIIILKDTIKEAIRNKLVLGIFGVFLILIFLYKLTGIMAAELQSRILKDMSIFTITFFTMVISSILTVHIFRFEIERGTLYFTLTYPVTKFQFIMGKILGLSIISIIMISILYFELFLMLLFTNSSFNIYLLYSAFILILKNIIIISLSMVFAISFSRVITISILSFIILTSHLKNVLIDTFTDVSQMGVNIINLFYGYIFPDFSVFAVDTGFKIDNNFFLEFLPVIILYTLSISLIYIFMATYIFERKDL